MKKRHVLERIPKVPVGKQLLPEIVPGYNAGA
jgi:hypothetical protein